MIFTAIFTCKYNKNLQEDDSEIALWNLEVDL